MFNPNLSETAMSSKLLLVLFASLAACEQPFHEGSLEDVSSIEAAVCSAPSNDDVTRMSATWAALQRPAMEAVGLDARGQQVMSRRFALMALGGSNGDVTCCDDYIGCFPTDVDEDACLAHLSLLGCSEGNVPTCDEKECWCSPTC
jgi:hypothetical protein